MTRIVHVASAQMGPISKSEIRKDAVKRLIAMMREAKGAAQSWSCSPSSCSPHSSRDG